jgi:hypothetical protein
MASLKTTPCVILSLQENMKLTKTKQKEVKLFKMLNITENQFMQARAWYLSAKEIQQKHIGKS